MVGGTVCELFVGRLYKQCGDWTVSLNTVCILLTAPEAWQIVECIEMGTLYSTFHLCLCVTFPAAACLPGTGGR